MHETNRVEYKQTLTDSLEKEAVAFLNADGGEIYIGIDKHGKPIGVNNCDEIQLKIKDKLNDNISPAILGLFNIDCEKQDGKDIIKVTIASGSEIPYYIKNKGMSERGCFTRIGSASVPMTRKMIDELYSKRIHQSLAKILSPNQALTFAQLRIYYEEKGLELGTHFAANLEFLTPDGKYNYIAYLCADQNGNSIKLAKYSSLDRCDLIENNEYGYCSLIKATKQVLEKLNVENKTLSKITPMTRIDTPLIDRVALREAVLNALIHNDYSYGTPPKFELFPDRIEITSAGTLPFGMNQTDFFEGYSRPRNREIMRIFKDLEIVEQLGSGLPRILNKYSKDCFEFTENFIRITFRFNQKVIDNVTDVTDNVTDNKDDRSKLILDALLENASISVSDLAKKLEVANRTILRDLDKLKKIGLVKRIGSEKAGYWEVIDKGT